MQVRDARIDSPAVISPQAVVKRKPDYTNSACRTVKWVFKTPCVSCMEKEKKQEKTNVFSVSKSRYVLKFNLLAATIKVFWEVRTKCRIPFTESNSFLSSWTRCMPCDIGFPLVFLCSSPQEQKKTSLAWTTISHFTLNESRSYNGQTEKGQTVFAVYLRNTNYANAGF